MNLTKIVFLVMFASLFSSCRDGRYKEIMESSVKAKMADPDQQRSFDGEIEPPFPDLDDNDDTILGIDSNKNGIRDDIDIWINRNSINSNERRAFRQLARAKTKEVLMLSEKRDDEFRINVNNVGRARVCMLFVSFGLRRKFPDQIRNSNIHNPFDVLGWLVYFSTVERQNAYNRIKTISWDYEGSSGGSLDGWEQCDFEVENLEEAKKLLRD